MTAWCLAAEGGAHIKNKKMLEYLAGALSDTISSSQSAASCIPLEIKNKVETQGGGGEELEI